MINRYLFIISGFLALCYSVEAKESYTMEELIQAIIIVESGGDDYVIGDRHLQNKAYGSLQIRQPCVDDVNERAGTDYRAEDMLGNRRLSVWCFLWYISRYATEERLGRTPTAEDIARIWNGGPNGYKKKSTHRYWSKVRKELEENRGK